MQIANVEYFYKYCNHKLGTGYTDDRKDVINIEWLCAAAQKVFIDIHQPKSGCTRLIATKLRENENRLIVDTEAVKAVVDYLYNFKLAPVCWDDCACPCACVCSGPCSTKGQCASSSNCNCDCACTCTACACNCGRTSECQCDCDIDSVTGVCACNCTVRITGRSECACNCNSACACACECACACPCSPPPCNPRPTTHAHFDCSKCCTGSRPSSMGYWAGWLYKCWYCHGPITGYSEDIPNCPAEWWCEHAPTNHCHP